MNRRADNILSDRLPISFGEATRNLNRANVEKYQRRILKLSEQLIAGELSFTEWQREMAASLKVVHVQNYVLGRGGIDLVSSDNWLSVGRELKRQYTYLRKFARDIKSEKLSKRQLLARSQMYADSATTSFWAGEQDTAIAAGYTEMRRHLSAADHCEDCPQYAASGWQKAGSLPMPTQQCQCRVRCKCWVEWR